MDISLRVPAKRAFCENVRTRPGPAFQCRRYNFFRMTHTIHSCGIDPVDAELERAVYRYNGRFVVLFAPAEFPAGASDSPGAKAIGVIYRSELPNRLVFMSDEISLSCFRFSSVETVVHRDGPLSLNSPLPGGRPSDCSMPGDRLPVTLR